MRRERWCDDVDISWFEECAACSGGAGFGAVELGVSLVGDGFQALEGGFGDVAGTEDGVGERGCAGAGDEGEGQSGEGYGAGQVHCDLISCCICMVCFLSLLGSGASCFCGFCYDCVFWQKIFL